jgi:excisionase family DNA binding protein
MSVKNSDPLLSIGEAATYLNTTTRWMRRSVAERRIRFTHLGRRLAFRRSWLDQYVESQITEPREVR